MKTIMGEFKINGRRIINQTSEELSEEYHNVLHHYRKMYINQIIDCVNEEMRGIPDHRIEEWIDEYLIQEINLFGRRENNNIEARLEESLRSQVNNNTYQEEKYRIHEDKFESIISDFRSSFIRKIEYYFDAFCEIDHRRFERCLDDINNNLKNTLNRVSNLFIQDYQQMINQLINKHNQKMLVHFEEQRNDEKISEDEYNRAETILNYNGYELSRIFDKLYVIDEKHNNIIDLKYNPKQHSLQSPDCNITISLKKQMKL